MEKRRLFHYHLSFSILIQFNGAFIFFFVFLFVWWITHYIRKKNIFFLHLKSYNGQVFYRAFAIFSFVPYKHIFSLICSTYTHAHTNICAAKGKKVEEEEDKGEKCVFVEMVSIYFFLCLYVNKITDDSLSNNVQKKKKKK